MSVLATVKHELRQGGVVSAYFLFCFAIVLTLKKLFLAQYEIELYALSAVVVGALTAGKVVLVLDKAMGARIALGRRPAVVAAYGTAVYTAVALLVIAGERVFHLYRENGALGRAISEAWVHRDRNVILAKVICVGLAFAAYHLFTATDRRLGKGTLWRAMWGRE